MSDIREYIYQFKPSRAIFAIKPDTRYSSLEFNLEKCEEMMEPDPGDDVIKKLVNRVVDQEWVAKDRRFAVDVPHTEERVLNALHSSILQFLDNNMDNQRPRQTNLYRWVSTNRGSRFQHIYTELYKYIVPLCDSRMTVHEQHALHKKNVILILQALQEKHS
jgi:hypothetical protein